MALLIAKSTAAFVLRILREMAQSHSSYSVVKYYEKRATLASHAAVCYWSETFSQLIDVQERCIIRQLLPSSPPGRVLDLGCGVGRLSPFLTTWGHVDGLDIPVMVKRARRENPHPMVKYGTGDITCLELPAGAYSLVLSVAALAIALRREELPSALRAIYTSLTPGGRLLMIEPFHERWLARPCRISPACVVKLLRRIGLFLEYQGGMVLSPFAICLSRKNWDEYPRLAERIYRLGEKIRNLKKGGFLNDYSVILARKPQHVQD
ncbi:MAG: class I SAM-dependent methyltransferase [Planctomycetota bacterium]